MQGSTAIARFESAAVARLHRAADDTAGSPPDGRPTSSRRTMVRNGPRQKTGRNEPVLLRSGKKYKLCHGR